MVKRLWCLIHAMPVAKRSASVTPEETMEVMKYASKESA